ncbi:Armadillo-type fold, partial [Cynara cardunculus var. scolymus]
FGPLTGPSLKSEPNSNWTKPHSPPAKPFRWSFSNMGREQPSQSQMAYTVEQLVAVNPYNPDILPDLENYVNEQVSLQTYSLDANLCLLRLYQFEPERMSTQIVAHILIKVCSYGNACPRFQPMSLLDSRKSGTVLMQMDEQFKTLIVLSHYLETAKFRQFWDEAAKSRHILEVVPGFEQAIQEYAVHVLSLTYQKVPRSVIAEAINMEGLSLDKFVEHHVANSGWVVEKAQGKGQLVSLPRNEFNHPELRRSNADIIPLDHITRIFPVLG